jgi:hypothetical protein
MTGFDQKTLSLKTSAECQITIEIDVTGQGDWEPYRTLATEAGQMIDYSFPDAFSAYWIRFVSDTEVQATAHLTYD